MQPDLYSTGKLLSDEEQITLERFSKRSRDIGQTYPKYRHDLAQQFAAIPEISFLDLQNVFDGVSEPVFIDDCHLVDHGYELIAEALAKAVSDVMQ